MRKLIYISFLVTFYSSVYSQQQYSIAATDSLTGSLFDKGDWKSFTRVSKEAIEHGIEYFDLDYRLGVAYYKRGMYGNSDFYFKKAYSQYKTEDLANHIYQGLTMLGFALEADVFKKEHVSLFDSKEEFKKGGKFLFADIGLRMSADASIAGTMIYASVGRFSRPSPSNSLYQSIYYLQQENPSSSFKQLEYFLSDENYLKNGWTLKPSLHYALSMYNSNFSGSFSFQDSTTRQNPPPIFGYTTVKRNGEVVNTGTVNGATNFLNIACAVNKRIKSFTVGLEPAIQVIPDRNRIGVSNVNSGIKDSFINLYHYPSRTYYDSNFNTIDTGSFNLVWQLGASCSFSFRIVSLPVFLKFSGFYLADKNGNSATAFNGYCFLPVSAKLSAHLSYTNKGALPWASNSDCQYFNSYNTIKTRAGLTLQYNSIGKISPMITYQYEQDAIYSTNKSIKYNSVYVTLKYKL